MPSKLNWPIRSVIAFLSLAVMLVSAFVWGGLESSPVHAAPNVSIRLTQLNFLRDMTLTDWTNQYDELRMTPRYSWMDWSQDGCSAPPPGSWWNQDFLYACLRHDFMWRTLAVASSATGKIWNERNRWVADNTLYSDLKVRCAGMALPRNLLARNSCYEAAGTFYQIVRHWQYDGNRTDAETISTNARPTDYIQYPSSTAVIDCGVVGSANRCLPVHYIELNGRPFSPQNIPYIAEGRLVQMNVVRANLQAPDGPPGWRSGNTGELVLNVTWPLRAGKTSIGSSCPANQGTFTPSTQTLYLDYATYDPSNRQPPTLDKTLKRTPIFVRACDVTTTSQENDDLLDIGTRQAYRELVYPIRYFAFTGGRVRHYENVRSRDCAQTRLSGSGTRLIGTPMTLSASGETEVFGSWLGTDCVHAYRSQPYIDYYTFTITRTMDLTIDLEYQGDFVDTFLYLYQRISTYDSVLALNDDHAGSLNSRINRTLSPGTYTIGASTYSAGATGDYRLHVRETPSCAVTPLSTAPSTITEYNSWSSTDCPSTRRPGRYADYYSFSITGLYARTVTIDLTSSVDTYLFLIQGDSTSGTAYLAYDDDGGTGYNSRISQTIYPDATYIIAVTTYGSLETGPYTLSVTGHR